MPTYLQVILATVLIVAASIWIGSYVNLILVSAVTRRTLDAPTRVAFFRALGRTHLTVSVPALIVAYAAGWVLLGQMSWDAGLTRMAVGSAVLLIVVVIGVIQARDLTRLRQRQHRPPPDPDSAEAHTAAEASAAGETGAAAGAAGETGAALAATIRRRSAAAAVARALIGIFTLGLIVNAAVLLVDAL